MNSTEQELRAGLFQIFHQSKTDGSLEFVAQSGPIKTHEDMGAFIKSTEGDHPLPEGYRWLVCNEFSEHFIKTYARESEE